MGEEAKQRSTLLSDPAKGTKAWQVATSDRRQ